MGDMRPASPREWLYDTLSQRRLDLGIRVVVSHYLPAEQPRALSRWERFRVWVEDLADRAEVYYHYPRVQRTEVHAYLLVAGRDLFVPRSAAALVFPPGLILSDLPRLPPHFAC